MTQVSRDAFDILDTDLDDIQDAVCAMVQDRILQGHTVASVVDGTVILHVRQDEYAQPELTLSPPQRAYA